MMDPGELSQPIGEMVPVDPRQLILERQQKKVQFAARKADEKEKERRRTKNKAAKKSRKQNR